MANLLLMLTVGGCTRSIDKDLVNAAADGDVHQVEILLSKGADPNRLALTAGIPFRLRPAKGMSTQRGSYCVREQRSTLQRAEETPDCSVLLLRST